MEKYLKYLLADITAASENIPVLIFDDPDEEMPFISLEEEEKTARREPLGERIGVKQEWFPPVQRLNEEQISGILEAMANCLDAYGFIPHFPTGLPLRRQYEVLVAYLGREVPILSYNPWQIDFCDYEPRTCPFGDSYCQCKVYEQWLSKLENDDGPLDEENIQGLIEKPGLPDYLLGHDIDEEGLFRDEEDEDYYEDDFDFEDEDWDEEDDDDPFFFGFSDFEPGPDDDDGCWN